MKLKATIMLIAGLLAAVCLVISIKSPDGSNTEKWSSFGLGLFSAVFIGNIISLFVDRNKAKKLG